MGLISNQSNLNRSLARYTGGGGATNSSPSALRSGWVKPSISTFINLPENQSVTVGYGWGNTIRMAISEGGIASTSQIHGTGSINATALEVKLSIAGLSGSGTLAGSITALVPLDSALAGSATISNAAISAAARIVASLTGSATIAANLNANVPISSAMVGAASLSPGLSGLGSLSADISPFTTLSPENLAAAVLNALLAEYNEAGSVGEALNNIGAAGNPWSSLLSANNDPGSFGERVQKLLTTNKFIGLK